MSKQKIYLGIDGGLSGGLSVIQDNNILELIVMPTVVATKTKREYDIYKIIQLFKKYPTATVILEKSHAMPLLGTVQAFNFGKNFGLMIGLLSALNMTYHIVHAKTWQKEMLKDINSTNTKAASIIVAQRLFPNINFRATARSKKIHDGLTDSALLGCYGQRQNL